MILYLQVVLILEILIRKCGFDAINLITPDKFKGFVRSVEEVRFKLLTCHLAVETIDYLFDQWGMFLVSSFMNFILVTTKSKIDCMCTCDIFW